MIPKTIRSRIYKIIADILAEGALLRSELMDAAIARLGLSGDEMQSTDVNGKKNIYRGHIGSILNEMLASGIINEDKSERYRLASNKPVVVRVERCEAEILKLLGSGAKSRSEISRTLTSLFGTDKTPTRKDDGRLADIISRTLRRLAEINLITYDGSLYALSKRAIARKDDIDALLKLKGEFLSRLHQRGGEFFEVYFMNLISRYLTKHGKEVTECRTTGGSNDGGIDGIVKTVDSLGFRETVMVQTKNRFITTNETDVRGFYGAVCAQRATRGIFATTGDFHYGARAFLDSIGECVGIDGERVFSIACECLYGIKREGERLSVDDRII